MINIKWLNFIVCTCKGQESVYLLGSSKGKVRLDNIPNAVRY